MSSMAIPWLPDSAIHHGKINSTINDQIKEWSSNWFIDSIWSIKEPEHHSNKVNKHELQLNKNKPNTKTLCFIHPNGLRIKINENGFLVIASAMLGKDIEYKNIRTSDLTLLTQIAQDTLNDLYKRLLKLFRLPEVEWQRVSDNFEYKPYLSTLISNTKRNPIITLEISKELIISLTKLLASDPRQSLPCNDVDHAIYDQITDIAAYIGKTKLKLSEIQELSVGDIISFETEVDNTLDIMVAEKIMANAAANLKFDNDKIYLEIKRETAQW